MLQKKPGLSTGIRDENGKEIHEGDIVKLYTSYTKNDDGSITYNEEFSEIRIIKWIAEIAGYNTDFNYNFGMMGSGAYMPFVIGSIYEPDIKPPLNK